MAVRQRGGWARPLAITCARLPLLALGCAATMALLRLTGRPIAFPPTPEVACLYFIVVNGVCLWLLRGILRREGDSLAALIGFSRARLGRDVLWGLLWLVVLYLPFVAAVIGTMVILFGADAFGSFERVFAPAPGGVAAFPFWFGLAAAIATATLFPLLNAPTEELWYRGYAQRRLGAATGRPWLGIVAQALIFGAQHLLLAPTVAGMAVYGVAFVVWGAGAGLIYHRQGRLLPLIVAHFATNFAFSLAPLIILLAT